MSEITIYQTDSHRPEMPLGRHATVSKMERVWLVMSEYFSAKASSLLDTFCGLVEHSLYITPVASAQGAKPLSGGFCFFGGSL